MYSELPVVKARQVLRVGYRGRMSGNEMREVGLVIVAGGSGSRMGEGPAKQYRSLLGIPILVRTVRAFYKHECISECVVVVPQSDVNYVRELMIVENAPWEIAVVSGGVRRQDSVLNGIHALNESTKFVAIHDGARPFPPENMNEAVLRAKQNGAVIFATPVTDTLKRVDNNIIEDTVPREQLWKAQTPQIFETILILESLKYCDNNLLHLTDDGSAVEQFGRKVAIINGSQFNLKITVPEDLILAEAIAERIIQ